MINSVRFECTKLAPNQTGKLSKDKDGFYTMPVGGLNVYNSAGQFYVYEEAKHLFEKSSAFMRRVQRGVLRAEVGHPVKEPGMSEQDYVRRILMIRETNVCAYHKEIWLDFNSVKDQYGKPTIAIMSKVCPSGPHAAMLQRMFEQEGENVCFSIRAFTRDYFERGVCKRILETPVTFDYVNEPGIHFAEKFKSPALEAEVIAEAQFTSSVMKDAVEHAPKGVGMESGLLTAHELFNRLGWADTTGSVKAPAYRGW